MWLSEIAAVDFIAPDYGLFLWQTLKKAPSPTRESQELSCLSWVWKNSPQHTMSVTQGHSREVSVLSDQHRADQSLVCSAIYLHDPFWSMPLENQNLNTVLCWRCHFRTIFLTLKKI